MALLSVMTVLLSEGLGRRQAPSVAAAVRQCPKALLRCSDVQI